MRPSSRCPFGRVQGARRPRRAECGAVRGAAVPPPVASSGRRHARDVQGNRRGASACLECGSSRAAVRAAPAEATASAGRGIRRTIRGRFSGVGRATNTAVVVSAVICAVLNYALSKLLFG